MAVTGTFDTLTADGNSSPHRVIGPVRLSLTNDFGTGTAKLQAQAPDGSWVDVANGSFTAATDTLFDFPEFSQNNVRVNLASSSSPDLDIWIQGNDPSSRWDSE